MPSPTYVKLMTTVVGYVDKAAAEGAIQRQLPAGTTQDSFSAADMKALALRIATALKLYVADTAKRAELVAKIQALA